MKGKIKKVEKSVSTIVKKGRDWEVWHDKETAKQVDDYWRSSGDEIDHRRRIARVVAEAMVTDFDNILEVGCGTGLIYGALSKELKTPPNYTGIDNAEPMLRLARSAFPGGNFKNDDALELGYDNREFDIVCCFEVLGHMPPLVVERALNELFRVAKHKVIFTVWLSLGEVELGSDHYAYPKELIMRHVNNAAGSRRVSITEYDVGQSEAFVVELQ